MRLSQKDFAAFIGLTTRQVRTLTDRGMPSEVDGNYRWYGTDAHAWYLETKIQEVRDQYEVTRREELEMEKLRHQGREAKVRADLAERSAVSVEDAAEVWAEGCEILRTAITRIPTRYGDVANPADHAAGEDALEMVAHELMDELREAFANPLGDELEAMDDAA